MVRLAGLGLAQEAELEEYASSYLAGTSRQGRSKVDARLALIRRPLKWLEDNHRRPNLWRAGAMARNYIRQQEMKL